MFTYVCILQNSPKLKIHLVIDMESLENVHEVLEGIVMDYALKAVDSSLNKVGIINLKWLVI